MEIEFELERETKNTVRYKEVVDDDSQPPFVGTLYVQKWALKQEFGEYPETLTVNIETAD